jgi:subtilisin family serine protease
MQRTLGRSFAPVIIFALLLGTAWTGRAPAARVDVDPALHAGEVALIQVAAGTAWTVAADLTAAGATQVAAFDSVNVVSARLGEAALASIATASRVLRVTTDATVMASGGGRNQELDDDPKGVKLDSPGIVAIGAPQAWKRSTGKDVVVALMDTGIGLHPDLPASKIVKRVNFVDDDPSVLDPAGHGTHLAGIIAANGKSFRGVAPDARLVDLRVLNRDGEGKLRDVVAAFDWLLKNRKTFGIGVLNLSFGARQQSSYHGELLAALAEAAWFSGVTVVAAAGNKGPTAGTVVMPGGDPFVITAGSFDDHGTAAGQDDSESSFSSIGPTMDGFLKPDVLAPGRRVVSLSALNTASERSGRPHGKKAADNVLYQRMSGTSVASAMVAGVAALVLSAHRGYSPTNVKAAVTASGRDVLGSPRNAVDAAKALTASADGANAGLLPSRLLMRILTSGGVFEEGVTWEGVSWEAVTWERLGLSVTWERLGLGVTWERLGLGVTWESVSWEGVMWETVSWEQSPLLDGQR